MGRRRIRDRELPPMMFKRRGRFYYGREGIALGDDLRAAMTRYSQLHKPKPVKMKPKPTLANKTVCPTCRRPFDTFERRYRNAARQLATLAVKRGILKPQPCEKCGADYAVKHHDDYKRPLDVRWLCPPCHVKHHQANGGHP